jgi:hypothetical protein
MIAFAVRIGGLVRLLRETLLEALVDFFSDEVAFVVFLSIESSTIRFVVPQVHLPYAF